ncbi:MAG: hypothetical protein FWD53_05300 [Phycisphaerales bacterium]|nr:hypothetical protein [Phycisphaerales bacterium]
MHYWKASHWLALGPSASGHLPHSPGLGRDNHPSHSPGLGRDERPTSGGGGRGGSWRWKNTPNLQHYLQALAQQTLPITQEEHLTPQAWAAEAAAFWLRLTEGLNYTEFQARTNIDPRPILEPALKKYADLDLVELFPTHARLTEKAIPISNQIFATALAAFNDTM